MLLTTTPSPLDKPLRREHLDRPAVPVGDMQPKAQRRKPSLAERVQIEPAGVRDWSSICKMVARNFPLETEQNMGYWLCHQLPYFRVARVDGEVAGFLHAQPRPDTGTLWVNLGALPLGPALTHSLRAFARRRGVSGCRRVPPGWPPVAAPSLNAGRSGDPCRR